MPIGDRKRTLRLRPRTGRAIGYCTGISIPRFVNRRFWRRFRRFVGKGSGRGFG